MRDADAILSDVLKLLALYRAGALGGETMPEDANPGLDRRSRENALYFTLPMALNYQRSSYRLWESAKATYRDKATAGCYCPEVVTRMPEILLKECLLKHGLALQPNKQPEIWRTLCATIFERFGGDVRNLFAREGFSVVRIKALLVGDKRAYPYLSGPKILNYWLYVMERYADTQFTDREHISVAPDTHVIQASLRLGVIDERERLRHDIQDVVSERWREILTGTGLCPIDVHTPLWLWSRAGLGWACRGAQCTPVRPR